MNHRYLAFDIETAKEVPGDGSNWRQHRPLGISCAATLASDWNEPRLWFSQTANGSPANQIAIADAKGLRDHLCESAAAGYTVLTWNGLGFDFDVLSEESNSVAICQKCAVDHVDMMFHLLCVLGFPVSLEKAAQGLGLSGKSPCMTGMEAPKFWAEGKHQQVLDYVAQDVRTTLQIAMECDRRRRFDWITQRGMKKSMPLPGGWLAVRDAMRLPEPDTTWMSDPILRASFTAWLSGPIATPSRDPSQR